MEYKLEDIDKNLGWHKFGCCRISPSESFEHITAKAKFVWTRMKQGHKVATEVKMKNGREIDAIDLTTGEFFEWEKNHKVDKKDSTRVEI